MRNYVPPSFHWGGSICINYLELFSIGNLSFPPNFVFIPMLILVWIYNIYFTLWITIQYYFILMLELYHLSPLVPLFICSWFLWLTHHCEIFFSIIFSFLLYFLGISLLSSTTDQFSSIQSLSPVRIFATPWTAACQASLSINNSQSLTKLMSIESVMPSSHLILCYPLLLLPSIFPSNRVF